jgi:hypothetical protein
MAANTGISGPWMDGKPIVRVMEDEMSKRFCARCGFEADPPDVFCKNCGARLVTAGSPLDNATGGGAAIPGAVGIDTTNGLPPQAVPVDAWDMPQPSATKNGPQAAPAQFPESEPATQGAWPSGATGAEPPAETLAPAYGAPPPAGPAAPAYTGEQRKRIPVAAMVLSAMLVVFGVVAATILVLNVLSARSGSQGSGEQGNSAQAPTTQAPATRNTATYATTTRNSGTLDTKSLPGSLEGVDVVWFTDGRIVLPIPRGFTRSADEEADNNLLLCMKGVYDNGAGVVLLYREKPERDAVVEFFAFCLAISDMETSSGEKFVIMKKDTVTTSGTSMYSAVFGAMNSGMYSTVTGIIFDDSPVQYTVNYTLTEFDAYPLELAQALAKSIQLVDGGEHGVFRRLN